MAQKILVVEDQPNVRENVTFLLELLGYEPQAAGNATEALAMLKQDRPDLVLSDVMMPDGDGFDLLRGLASLDNAPPVILMSALTAPDDINAALSAGAVAYITKPFTNDRLAAIIAQHCPPAGV